MRSRSWVSALALAVVLAATGCAGGSEEDQDPTLTVYVSLPPEGDGRDAADGARMAFEDAGRQAAGTAVRAEFLDAWDEAGRWSPVRAAANARTAIQDSTAIAYLGDFESGATRASLPVTNSARMLQVSPASAAGDLVEDFPGAEEVPATQPSDERTFGRVIPSDRAQARAAAHWTRRLAGDNAAAIDDGTRFGNAMRDEFLLALGSPGVKPAHIELLFYAGLPEAQRRIVPPESRPRLMVSDAELAPGVSEPDGTLATSAALDPDHLPPAGREFADAFRAEYGRTPGRYAAYGYEAMAVILDSIDRASDPADRDAVVDAFFATRNRDSILGTYSIDEVGDTTLDRMSGYEFGPGGPRAVTELQATR